MASFTFSLLRAKIMALEAMMLGKWIKFALAVLVAGSLLWVGFKFLNLDAASLSKGQLLLYGMVLVLSGFTCVSADFKDKWFVGPLLLAAGIYLFARAGGYIETAWLAKLFGLMCWVAACGLIYSIIPSSGDSGDQKSVVSRN